ncbi:cupin domain-containing protein [Pseudonocardia benzenivorans]|uniref:Cupin domain-containing protein n=1 Tax=Pseudonocardia benzenivorans TaxID=228005 RepID=A0ABW3VHC8_9PSEU
MSDDLESFRAGIARQRTPLPRDNEDARFVIRTDEVQWYTPKGTNPSHLGPVLGLPIKSFELFLQEIPAGGSSDMQQHHHEAVHYIMSGRGYSEIGPGRYEWATGDFVSIPPMEWHRHYNSDDSEPVRMLLIENSKLLDALDLNYRTSAGLVTWAELQDPERDPHTH